MSCPVPTEPETGKAYPTFLVSLALTYSHHHQSSSSHTHCYNYSLKEVEANIAALTEVQGQSIDTFMKQMDEYRKLQTKIQESLQAKIIQNLIEVVFISDNDKDFVIGKSEVDGLLHRLKSIEGVNFSEANFKRAIEKAGFDFDTVMKEQGGFDLTAVIHVVENLLDDNVPEKDNIFQIDTQQLLPTPIRTNLRNKSKRK